MIREDMLSHTTLLINVFCDFSGMTVMDQTTTVSGMLWELTARIMVIIMKTLVKRPIKLAVRAEAALQ